MFRYVVENAPRNKCLLSADKFDTYTAFAHASVQEMFEGRLDSSLTLEANEFRITW